MPKPTGKKTTQPLTSKLVAIPAVRATPAQAQSATRPQRMAPVPATVTSIASARQSTRQPAKKVLLPKKEPIRKTPKQPTTTFILHAPEAQEVSVSGEFNGWLPGAAPMQRQRDGRWETALALRPGRYQYKFVADGQWLHDPNAPESVANEYGSLNSVIEVRA